MARAERKSEQKADTARSVWTRAIAIRRELTGIPLGWFTVGDLPALHRLLGIHRNIMNDPREDDLKLFEEVIANCQRRQRILQQIESGDPVQGLHKRKRRNRPRSKQKEMR